MVGFLRLKDFLEDVFETAIVGLQDGILGAHVQRPLLLDGVLEAAVSETSDGLHKDHVRPRSEFFIFRFVSI